MSTPLEDVNSQSIANLRALLQKNFEEKEFFELTEFQKETEYKQVKNQLEDMTEKYNNLLLEHGDQGDVCAICQNKHTETRDFTIHCINCNKGFCKTEFDEWIKKSRTCPNCRCSYNGYTQV